jgi:hypothetical protein
MSEEQWKMQVVAEVEKIMVSANEKRALLAKMIISSAPKVPSSSYFFYYAIINEKHCGEYLQECAGSWGVAVLLPCIVPLWLAYWGLCFFVFVLLSLFCDLPLGRWENNPATSEEVEWYTRLMSDNPDLDTFAIDDMVKEELDKLVVRLRDQFSAYKGLHVYTGADTVDKGSGAIYTLDLFLIVFDEVGPVVGAANSV